MADPATAAAATPAPLPAAAAGALRVTITEVPITPEVPSGIKVDPNTFHVSKGKDPNRTQIEWFCASSGFKVEFKDKSPFVPPLLPYSRTTPGSVYSGPVGDVQPDDNLPDDQRTHYKYSVKIGGVLDPDGEVDQ
jgi:hypothetical protein